MDDHLGQRDLGRPDRMVERALEVDHAEQLAAVDDGRRDLAPDIVAGRPIVGILRGRPERTGSRWLAAARPMIPTPISISWNGAG